MFWTRLVQIVFLTGVTWGIAVAAQVLWRDMRGKDNDCT